MREQNDRKREYPANVKRRQPLASTTQLCACSDNISAPPLTSSALPLCSFPSTVELVIDRSIAAMLKTNEALLASREKKNQDLNGCSISNSRRKEAVRATAPTCREHHTAANEVRPCRFKGHRNYPLLHHARLSTFPCPPLRLPSKSPSAFSCVSRTTSPQVLAGQCFGEKVAQTVASPAHNLTSAFGHLFTRGR